MQLIQCYFTRHFVISLNQVKQIQPEKVQRLLTQWLPDLQRYPSQGRLLLNRAAEDAECDRLRWQLVQRFSCKGLREACFDDVMVLYLIYDSQLYFLSLLVIDYWDHELENRWDNT